MPFLYTIVMHDSKNKLLISIADFVSCCQNEIWISKNLFYIKGILSQNIANKNRYVIAPIIVTDFSYALINSIHQAFNGCTLLQYIMWTFDYLTKNDASLKDFILVRTYLCCVHFLKNISKKAKSIVGNLKNGKNVLKTFLFAFTLLQNSINLTEFEENIRNIYFIFNLRTENDSFYKALTKTRIKLANREIENFFIHDKDDVKEVQDHNSAFFNKILVGKLSKSSPFVNYFNRIIDACKLEIQFENVGMNQNRFYYPELFNIIQQNFYSVPLWSCIVIGKWQMEKYGEIRFTRLSNNPCENYIGHVKNHLLKKNDTMPSEFCSILYESLQSKYFLHYFKGENLNFKSEKLKKNVEKWQKKKNCEERERFLLQEFFKFWYIFIQ